MTAHDWVYFELEGMRLTDQEVGCAREIDRLLVEIGCPFVDSDHAAATVGDAGFLSLEVGHQLVPEARVLVEISREGELAIFCEAAHPGFALRFNLVWEPEESLGGVGEALVVFRALLEGRVESEVWWAGNREGEAKSFDYMVAPDGSRTKLYSQYHAEGLIETLGRADCERRRISFLGPGAIEISPCPGRPPTGS
jgi:hypothetical protein